MEKLKNEAHHLLCDANGQTSSMRLCLTLTTIVTLCIWIAGIIIEQRFIPPTWEMVALITGGQGFKALQRKFE